MNCKLLIAVIVAFTVFSTIATGQNTPVRFEHACVVTDSKIASQVGADILKKGGNAVDAAIATAFALAVTYPTAGNLGGGGFMLIRLANGQSTAIDYRERAPLKATKDMYLDAAGKVVPNSSTVGYKAVGVPGTVAGMWEAHKRFGKLKWPKLVHPAVDLAKNGFAVSFDLSQSLRSMSRLFSQFPESYRVFNRKGKFYEWGERLVQPEL